MAGWYTLYGSTANGIVTRTTTTASQADFPPPNLAEDPWFYAGVLPLPAPSVGDHFIDGEYENDDTALSTAQGNKIAALRDACANHIKNLGFAVNGLLPPPATTVYVFPSAPSDQQNIMTRAAGATAARVAGTSPEPTFPLWSGIGANDTARVDDATQWDIRDWSIDQMRVILDVMQHHVEDAQYELQAKTADTLAATTVSAVNAVTWVPPNS